MSYPISERIRTERNRHGWNQADLARRLGFVGQQTISRWERGASRPERKTISRLAELLELDANQLFREAGYASATADSPRELERPIRPLVSRLPLDKLSPDQFEQFMHDLVRLEQQDQKIKVHRFGTQGETQYGIDLIVQRGKKTIATVQCKRRKSFGPAAVRAAVSAVRIEADRHYLALTRPASPGARLEMRNHPRWTLWDIDDISQEVRLLPMDQQVRLVDTYFPWYREDFLGVPAPSPWLTIDEFFQTDSVDKLYSHKWALVGRHDVVERVESFLAGTDRAALLKGRGGIGKTRLLLEVGKKAEGEDKTDVRLLSSGAEVKPEDFELLPQAAKLLIMMDDVHERADVDYLLAGIWRVRPDAKVLLAVRPYGLTQLYYQLGRIGLHSLDTQSFEIDDLRFEDAESLAREILGSGSNKAVSRSIADISRDCPLITVVGAGLIKRGILTPSQIDSNEEIRSEILRRFKDSIVAGAYGRNIELGNSVLAGIALLQPFSIADNNFQTALEEITGVSFDRVMPHIRSFQDAGVLLRRGNSLRVIPDLLGDVILLQACFDEQSGASTGLIERSYKAIKGEPLQNAFVNTSRIDWQIRKGDTSLASPVDQLWNDVIVGFKKGDIHERKRVLRLVKRAAYFRPDRALELVSWAIGNPTDNIAGLGSYEYTYRDVLQDLPSVLRLVAYDFDYMEEACNLLWTLAQADDRKTNPHPDHPLRVLTDLAEYGQGKPVLYHERLLDVAQNWFAKMDAGSSLWSPFDVLEPLLATEGADQHSSGRTISFSPFGINPTAVEKLRDRVVKIALEEARNDDLGRAVRGVNAIASSLQYPHGIWGRRPDETERKTWEPLFVKTINSLRSVAADDTLDPVISVAIGRAVRWHADYLTGKVRSTARNILRLLPATLEHEMALLMADTWDLLRNPEKDYRRAEQQLQNRVNKCATSLVDLYGDNEIVEILERRIDAQIVSFGTDQGNPGQLVWALVFMRPSVGLALCTRIADRPESVLINVLSICLGQLLQNEPKPAMDLIQLLLEQQSLPITRSVAHAFGWNRGPRKDVLSGEVELLKNLAVHPDPHVRRHIPFAAHFIVESEGDKYQAIEVITSTKFDDSALVAKEFFSAMEPHGRIKWKDIPEEEADTILEQLRRCPSIDEYFITEFLSELSKTCPERVIRLLKERIEFAERADPDVDYRALPFRWHSQLKVRECKQIPAILDDVLTWIAERPAPWQRRRIGRELFRATAVNYDELVIKVLVEAMHTGSEDKVNAVAAVLAAAPVSFVLENVDMVRSILVQAAARGDKCLKRFNDALFESAISNDGEATWGRWPFSTEQLAQCRENADHSLPGSVEYRFYKSLERFCDETTHADAIEDEMLFDDREW